MRKHLLLALMALAPSAAAVPAMADSGVLHVYTWADYVSPNLLKKFTAETGIKVTVDNYDSNDALLSKLQAGASGYDVAIPSNNFVGIMSAQGLLEKVEVKSLPNYKYVDERWRGPAWDPTQSYTVPWMWGTTSVAYLSDKVPGGIDSLKQFFEPSDAIKGKIQVLRSQDGMPELASLYLSLPFCTAKIDDLKKIQAAFLALKPSVKMFDDTGMADHLAAGETMVTLWYSGNVAQARMANLPKLRYVFPKEGVMGWFDNIVVPKGAPNYKNAVTFMNFVMDPKNIAIESDYAVDANAISASKAYLDPKVASSPELTVPSDVPLRFAFQCPPATAKLNSQVWSSVLK
jgi:spermidine/putrescine transport system substrate-binding protein